jgi:methyl-accepting chemotaxis protein
MMGLVEGRVDRRVTGQYHAQFNTLKKAVNGYCEKMHNIVLKIRESSQLVKSGAEEISRGNLELSRRTESQAASLEETSASMEEMTSTVKQNADNAKEANELAMGARDQASTGGDVVSKAISAMHEINQASTKISDIIGVIDEIAFQTNLLALNAAVEAARAGEQGRGFAVVATEVRNLAGRSATAAKEIKELIEDSVQKVTDGSRLVNQSGDTLEEIMGSVRQVAEIVGDISSATQEQAQGIDQVNKAIIEMDSATQQNTAMVEEAAAAAESMSEQSNELDNLVSFFQIADGQSASSASHIPGGVERRTSDRPWSGNAKQDLGSHDLQKAVGSDVDDGDWEEF